MTGWLFLAVSAALAAAAIRYMQRWDDEHSRKVYVTITVDTTEYRRALEACARTFGDELIPAFQQITVAMNAAGEKVAPLLDALGVPPAGSRWTTKLAWRFWAWYERED